MMKVCHTHNSSREQHDLLLENAKKVNEDSITLTQMENPISIECGHMMDRSSFEEVVAYAQLHNLVTQCPLCVKKVDQTIIIPGFQFKQVVLIVSQLLEENDLLIQENDLLSQRNDLLSQENDHLRQENERLVKLAKETSECYVEKVWKGFIYYFHVADRAALVSSWSEAKNYVDEWYKNPDVWAQKHCIRYKDQQV